MKMTSPKPTTADAIIVSSNLSFDVFHDCFGDASAPMVIAVISGNMISLSFKSSDAVTILTAKASEMKAGSNSFNRFTKFTFPYMITSNIIQLFRLKFNWIIL